MSEEVPSQTTAEATIASPSSGDEGPLFVDLDGTLIATDTLAEGLILSVRKDPWVLFAIPGWLSQGRPTLKRRVAERVSVDAATLPYRADVLEFLKREKSCGRKLVLITASDRLWAQKIADHLQLFDEVIATDLAENLKGANKLHVIERWMADRGEQRFCYIGDAWADTPIWTKSATAYLVAPSTALLHHVRSSNQRVETLAAKTPSWRAMWRVLRPHQWAKNVLVFAPLVFAHRLLSIDRVTQACLAFICLCACASATYIINDLLDLESDRHHPRKRNRPFASGALSVMAGPPLTLGLLAGAFALAAVTLPWEFLGCLAAYVVLTLAYSLWLKRKMLVDVFLLAGLYTLRIIAGGEATDIQPSEWLLAMSMFLFTSLAFVKRYAELLPLADENQPSAKGRGYLVSDLSLIESFGSASAYLSVLVLALYIHSDRAQSLYGTSRLLWFVCPLMLYWTTRIWMQAKRRIMHDDPLLYAFKDRVSWIVAVLIAALMVLSL